MFAIAFKLEKTRLVLACISILSPAWTEDESIET
jgi:hypothetical protein